MKILFKQLQGQDLEVDLPHRSTPGDVSVDELREAIAGLIPEATPERQRLIYRGRVLKSGSSLADYSWEEGNPIHLMVRAQEVPANPQAEPQPQQQQQQQLPPPPHEHARPPVFEIRGMRLPAGFEEPIQQVLQALPGVQDWFRPQDPQDQFGRLWQRLVDMQELLERPLSQQPPAAGVDAAAAPDAAGPADASPQQPPQSAAAPELGVGSIRAMIGRLQPLLAGMGTLAGQLEQLLPGEGPVANAAADVAEGEPLPLANRLADLLQQGSQALGSASQAIRSIRRMPDGSLRIFPAAHNAAAGAPNGPVIEAIALPMALPFQDMLNAFMPGAGGSNNRPNGQHQAPRSDNQQQPQPPQQQPPRNPLGDIINLAGQAFNQLNLQQSPAQAPAGPQANPLQAFLSALNPAAAGGANPQPAAAGPGNAASPSSNADVSSAAPSVGGHNNRNNNNGNPLAAMLASLGGQPPAQDPVVGGRGQPGQAAAANPLAAMMQALASQGAGRPARVVAAANSGGESPLPLAMPARQVAPAPAETAGAPAVSSQPPRPQPQQQRQQPQQPQQPQQQPDLGRMLQSMMPMVNQMLGGMNSGNNSGNSSGAAPLTQNEPRSQQQQQLPQQQQQQQQPDLSRMLQSMMPMVGQMLGGMNSGGASGGGGGAPANLQSMLQGLMGQLSGGAGGAMMMDDDDDEGDEGSGEGDEGDAADEGDEDDEDRVPDGSELLYGVVESLQMPDLFQLATGGQGPAFEKIRVAVRRNLLNQAVRGDSPEFREALAARYTNVFQRATVLNPAVLREVSGDIRPGHEDLDAAIRPLVRQRLAQLIDAILDSPAQPAEPAAGGPGWNHLVGDFFGAWMAALVPCFHGGIDTVGRITNNCSQRVFSLAPELSGMSMMIAPMVNNYFMGKYREYLQRQADGEGAAGAGQGLPAWVQLIPEAEREQWLATIARDEERQQRVLEEARSRQLAAQAMFEPAATMSDDEGPEDEAKAPGSVSLSSLVRKRRSAELQVQIQQPFSQSYRSGSAGSKGLVPKRQKLMAPPVDPSNSGVTAATAAENEAASGAGAAHQRALIQQSLVANLRSAISVVEELENKQQSEAAPQADDANAAVASQLLAAVGRPGSKLAERYAAQVVQDLGKRVEADPEFVPARFPQAAQVLLKPAAAEDP